MLLGRELLQQVLVGGVGGAVLACRGQPLAQAMLVGEEEPHLAAPALGNAWGTGGIIQYNVLDVAYPPVHTYCEWS